MLRILCLAVMLGSAASPVICAVDECEKDAAKYCPKTSGGAEWDTCMRSNMDSLSEGCKAHLKSVVAFAADPCEKDLARFCRSVPSGSLQKFNCLYKNELSLSEGCKAELRKMRPCKKQISDFCSAQDVPLNKISYCLYENRADVGEACGKSAGIKYDYKEICFDDAKKAGCKLEKAGDISACISSNMDKMSKTCLKSWIKRPPSPPGFEDSRKKRDAQARKLIESK